MDVQKLKNLAAKNEVRIDDYKGHKSSPAYFYSSLRNALGFYFNTFQTKNESYEFYVSSTATNIKKNLTILESQFLDEENTVLSLVAFERFFELFLKDILKKTHIKLTYKEQGKRTTWQRLERIKNNTFEPHKPDGKRIHKIPFRETIQRFYDLIDYMSDPAKQNHSLVKRFSKAFTNFSFLANIDYKGTLEFINWYRDEILHIGNKLPRLRFFDFIVTQRILPIVKKILDAESSIPVDWLYFTKTISGIEILTSMININFEVRNNKSNKRIKETYDALLCIGHLKELGRANMKMNNSDRNNRSAHEYNYHDVYGRGERFALAEKNNHPNAKQIKKCPCCNGQSLVHYVKYGSELPIKKRENIEWLKCYTCDYYIPYNVYDLHYFNQQFEKHFGNMEIEWKRIVRDSHLPIIKGTLNRIMLFEIDSIMNYLIRLHIENPPKADEVLLVTDKFYIYKNLWGAVMNTLYEKYLPMIKYEFKWELEVTPYTLMLCDLTKDQADGIELGKTKATLKIIDSEIERDFTAVLLQLGFDKIGLGDGLKGRIPDKYLPASKREHLNLIFRLMNFPPLTELSLFLGLYNNVIKAQFEKLSTGFSGVDASKVPNFGMSESLHYSFFHINHETFKKHGIEAFKNHPALSSFGAEFDEIKKKAEEHKDKFTDTYICPCCGEKQEVSLPEEILQYKFLLEKQHLSKIVGLLYLDEFTQKFKENLSEKFYSFLPEINRVDNPDCVILVEGESEDASIPILSFRTRFILSQHNIQVYNSKSKQKLREDFFSMKNNYPNRKIICLLDSDAKKEKEDIERVIKDHRNKYRCVFIEKGTFEDLFDLAISIEVLNSLYPDGELITQADFDPNKDFLSNIGKIMFHKKQAQFDKVVFAKTICLRIDTEKLPKEIVEILEIAKQFSEKPKFIKN